VQREAGFRLPAFLSTTGDVDAMSGLNRISDAILRALLAIAMTALFLMMLVIVADVGLRFTINKPLTGAYDGVEILLVISVFYGMPAVIAGRHEIVIDLIDHFAPAPFVEFLRRFSSLLSALILGFMFLSMIDPARQAYLYGDMKLELNLPVWIVWVIALGGMAGGVIVSILNLFGVLSARQANSGGPR
jgi:TRAP-type C4-dicarboxylate transport system permease small subunit